MACKSIIREHNLNCESIFRKYYQQIILINKDDVNEVKYSSDIHGLQFNLLSDKTGYLYRGNEIASNFSASFSKSVSNGQPVYSHTVTLPIVGVGAETKLILRDLDLSNYFAVIQFRDETIEVYGFENGLTTNNYNFEAQNNMGGINVSLESKFDEDEPPYIYIGDKEDFNNKFAGIGDLLGGDFNNDFNNDFFIIEA